MMWRITVNGITEIAYTPLFLGDLSCISAYKITRNVFMRIFFSMFLFSILSACGGSGSPVGTNDVLMGTWQSTCYSENGKYHIDTYIFNNANYFLDTAEYEDESCNTYSGQTDSFNGSYTVGLNVTSSDGENVTRLTMNQAAPSERTIKLVFRISGAELSMGEFMENRTPELAPEMSYIRQSDSRQLACTSEAVFGIKVSVLAASSRQHIGCGASVIIKDGNYYKKIDNPDVDNCNESYVFSGAQERIGTYDIIIQKAGFDDWHQDDLVVTPNSCHVNSTSINAFLNSSN